MAMKLYRQGDVLLIRVKSLPENAKAHRNVLAMGEATGHAHAVIDGEVLVDERGKLYVRAEPKTVLRHQTASGEDAEHLPLVLEPGLYEVRIEEEYHPEGLRKVED
jgi:hypothetical protein